MNRLILSVAMFAASLAVASPKQISMPVGHITTVSMPSSVTRVKADDASLVDVRREGRKVTIVGRSKGTTDVTVTTAEGETKLHVYVASDRFGLP